MTICDDKKITRCRRSSSCMLLSVLVFQLCSFTTKKRKKPQNWYYSVYSHLNSDLLISIDIFGQGKHLFRFVLESTKEVAIGIESRYFQCAFALRCQWKMNNLFRQHRVFCPLFCRLRSILDFIHVCMCFYTRIWWRFPVYIYRKTFTREKRNIFRK